MASDMAYLRDRGVLLISGPDRREWLDGLITNSVPASGSPVYAGLLSPQGKVLFEFIVVPTENGVMLDVAKDRLTDLTKRLSLYKLRKQIEIADISSDYAVLAAFEGHDQTPYDAMGRELIASHPDPRLGQPLIRRDIRKMSSTEQQSLFDSQAGSASLIAYHRYRIALGVPEDPYDYASAEVFPHEANFDLLQGVSFTKGCYVGQEIVARMEHRATVRKRIVRVAGATDLPAGRPDVVMGEVVIGKLGSVAGSQGLAMIRLDRAIEAIDKGTPITAAGIPLVIDADMISRQRRLMAAKAGADLAPPQ
jgi:tRNA-modifying protein YgfZ